MDSPDSIPGVLACDVGNTNIRLAAVCGEDVSDVRVVAADSPAELAAAVTHLWETMADPRRIVASSVAPEALAALEAAVDTATGQEVLVVGRDLPLPIATDLPAPEAVGTDRLCAAVAAYDRLGDACIIADFGTAITIDCVSDAGVFLGGAILPGVSMAADSLADRTAQLPRVTPAEPTNVLGKDTAEAIRSGLIALARGGLRDRVEAYANELGHWPLVVCTGGDAGLIVGDLARNELVQAVVEDLTLRGIAIAYYKSLVK